MAKRPGDGTRAVHAGAAGDPRTGSLPTPIYRASTFRAPTTRALLAAAAGRGPRGFYTRYGNPNFAEAERALAALAGTEGALLFASGMAAVSCAVLSLVRAGERVAAYRDLYGGTRNFLVEFLSRFGVGVDLLDAEDGAGLARSAAAGARVLLLESPTNPLLRVLDLRAVARRARRLGLVTVLDDTIAGPAHTRAAADGIDLLVYAATKSLGGHSDLLAGFVAGRRGLLVPVERLRRVLGPVPDPETAWLLARGMRTYPLRAARQAATAAALARVLARDPRVLAVHHPLLPGRPDRAAARRLRGGAGCLLTIEVRGGLRGAARLVDRLRLVANAPSFGGCESLASLPRLTSHASLPAAERRASGIADGLVRISVGLEDLGDLREDLSRALGGS